MTSLFFFFLLLASLLQVVLYAMMSQYCPIPLTPPLPPNQYDHFQLVKTWIPAFCHLNQCERTFALIANFTTHGMWPANSRGITVTCPGMHHKIGDFSKLLSDTTLTGLLEKVWPSIKANYKTKDFWKHEWKKHGICSAQKLDCVTYFQTVLYQTNKRDLLDILTRAHITPRNDVAYRKVDIQAAIQRVTGMDVYVSCKDFEPPNATYVVLYEIYLCIDFTGINDISCPSAATSDKGCGGKAIIFLPS